VRQIAILFIGLYLITPTCGFAAYYHASELGRLLTTPAQRHRIDAMRNGNNSADTNEKNSTRDIKMQGIVTPSSGRSTVWINGKSTLQSNNVDGVNVRLNSLNGRKDTVTVIINGKRVRMKPGQVWSESSGRVTDNDH